MKSKSYSQCLMVYSYKSEFSFNPIEGSMFQSPFGKNTVKIEWFTNSKNFAIPMLLTDANCNKTGYYCTRKENA